MSQGTLTIYNASAGSGKTFTLTGLYLVSLFKSRFNYRKILAVTFTNKATSEMKSRILENLHCLASGQKCEYLEDLKKNTGKTEEFIRNEASAILNHLLHDFSRFSVTTIDSFFQKVLRAFSREAGLNPGFNIDLDNELWLNAAIEETISGASTDNQLRDWLLRYAIANIEAEKSWNLESSMVSLARELFNEKFRILSRNVIPILGNKSLLAGYINTLDDIITSFRKRLKENGLKAADMISAFGLTDDMFYRKGQGIPRYIRLLASGEIADPNSYVREVMNEPPRWSKDKPCDGLEQAINSGLGNILRETITFYDRHAEEYRTAKVILSNVYALGILSDVFNNIHRLTSSENTFLLSDSGEFLNRIIADDQCPFIYEKVGNTFENFMIDEFQDTSIIQWQNFHPLILNGLALGEDSLVVGDIKQSIYRWRNSDWKILSSLVNDSDGDTRILTKPLSVNWRSRANIISFNNRLFSFLPGVIDDMIRNDVPGDKFHNLYSEAIQADPGKLEGGYVRFEMVESDEGRSWEDKVLEKIPFIIESYQEKGYAASDIGILVRDGRQGSMVLNYLINYSNNCDQVRKSKYNYNVVSNDSLLLSGSAVINFIISLLSYSNDNSDQIALAAMQRYYLMVKGDDRAGDVIPCMNSTIDFFPEGYEDFIISLKEMPLFEMIERIILFFGLGEYSYNAIWLNTLQDSVLNYIKNGNTDLVSFLDWWSSAGSRKSVVLPDNQDAIRIMTIHKSKGLEFSIVILPFISWDLDHPPLKQPILWVQPDVSPFSEIGIVPVRYSSELTGTVFSDDYLKEKHSIYFDNLNLFYVAATRAKDALYGFVPADPKKCTIASALIDTFCSVDGDNRVFPEYISESRLYEYGTIPSGRGPLTRKDCILAKNYKVTPLSSSLRLKLHGENYFSPTQEEKRKRINYGKIMHEIFEGIDTASDIPGSVRKLVLEGKLPEDDASEIENKVRSLICSPEVSGWFDNNNHVLKEAGILLTTGNIRRPDRVIIKDGKTTVIDFKFGSENNHYLDQIRLYRDLLSAMGYKNIEALIWYVDKNKIVSA